MSNYYFAIVGATDNPIYETEIIPSSRSSAFIDSNRVNLMSSRFFFFFFFFFKTIFKIF
jgi:hypothetical protein